MIERLQSGSRRAVQVMDKGRNQAHASVKTAANAQASLAAITLAVGTIKDASLQIAEASAEQSSVTATMDGNISYISDAVKKTSQGSIEMTAKAGELDHLSNEMLSLVQQFKID